MESGSRPAAITWWAVNAQTASLGPGGEGMTSTAASCGGNRPDAAASSMPRRGWGGASKPGQAGAGSYTDTWRSLAPVNGSPLHPPHRLRSRRPARRAMRSSSGG